MTHQDFVGAEHVSVGAAGRRVCDPLPGRCLYQLAQHNQQPMLSLHVSMRRMSAQCRKSASSFSTISGWSTGMRWLASSMTSMRASGSRWRKRAAIFGPSWSDSSRPMITRTGIRAAESGTQVAPRWPNAPDKREFEAHHADNELLHDQPPRVLTQPPTARRRNDSVEERLEARLRRPKRQAGRTRSSTTQMQPADESDRADQRQAIHTIGKGHRVLRRDPRPHRHADHRGPIDPERAQRLVKPGHQVGRFGDRLRRDALGHLADRIDHRHPVGRREGRQQR